MRRGHEEGFSERCGYYEQSKRKTLQEAPFWIHAVSVGEVQAAYPLITELRRRGYRGTILLSTVTVTGKIMAEKLIKVPYTHIFAPWDAPQCVDRAVSALKPCVYITLETEIWPNLLATLKQRGVRAYLANARISDRALARCKGWRKNILRALLEDFEALYAREPQDAQRLTLLGVDPSKIECLGDCKIDALFLRRDEVTPQRWYEPLQLDPKNLPLLLLAGSTHAGEESVILEAFRQLQDSFTERPLRLIVAPRHPERSASLLPEASQLGKTALLSSVCPNWDILIVDRIGVLFELYSLAFAAFVGGSLVPKGGQNLLEVACWGIPVQHGPHMDDFALSARELGELGVAQTVTDSRQLCDCWLRLLLEGNQDKESRKEKSTRYFDERAGAAAAICDRVFAALPVRN